METDNKRPKLVWLGSRLALLLVGIIWGSSLVVVKSSTDAMPPNLLVALRFTLAFVLLAIVFFRRLKKIDRSYLKSGAIIGACLFLAYWIQTVGVTLAMPGKSAFLSSIYCVLVPFLYWIFYHRAPRQENLLAAALCVLGILLASVTADFGIAPGDALALLSGVFFAAHIVAVGKYGEGKDPIVITILQFGFCALLAWLGTLTLERGAVAIRPEAVGGVLYLGVCCTGIALLLQNLGQKYADPSSASILMSTESVFGVAFSVVFMGERITAQMLVGFLFIFISVLVSELGLSFKRGHRKEPKRSVPLR